MNKAEHSGMKEAAETVSLKTLAKLTGFSSEFIKNEFSATGDSSEQDVYSLTELREIMLRYLDVSMMRDEAS